MYAAAVVLPIVAAVCALVSYNRLESARVRVTNAWSDLETQFARRHEFADKLTALMSSRVAGLHGAIEEVRSARLVALEVSDPQAQEAAESALGSALRALLAAVEGHPALADDFDFRNLRSLLVSVENHISCARRCYNAAARKFNERRETFPALFIARWTAMPPFDQFQLDDQECRPMPRLLKAA